MASARSAWRKRKLFGRLIGDEDAVLDRLVQRFAHLRLAKSPRQRRGARTRRRVRRPMPLATGSASDRRADPRAAAAGRAGRAEARRAGRSQPRGALRRRRGFLPSGRRSCRSAPPVGESRSGPQAASSAPRTRAARARGEAPSPSDEPRPRAGACAPPRRARPRGRSRAAEPAGRRGCARGRR